MLTAVAAFGLALAVAEIGANLWLTQVADEEAFRRYASFGQLQRRYSAVPYSPHRYLGYYPTPGFRRDPNRHNSLGFRGEEIETPKPAGQFRIVCLGDSLTEGFGVCRIPLISEPMQLPFPQFSLELHSDEGGLLKMARRIFNPRINSKLTISSFPNAPPTDYPLPFVRLWLFDHRCRTPAEWEYGRPIQV